jgi:hypothetical protein
MRTFLFLEGAQCLNSHSFACIAIIPAAFACTAGWSNALILAVSIPFGGARIEVHPRELFVRRYIENVELWLIAGVR